VFVEIKAFVVMIRCWRWKPGGCMACHQGSVTGSTSYGDVVGRRLGT
jgi:hypothetical protein